MQKSVFAIVGGHDGLCLYLICVLPQFLGQIEEREREKKKVNSFMCLQAYQLSRAPCVVQCLLKFCAGSRLKRRIVKRFNSCIVQVSVRLLVCLKALFLLYQQPPYPRTGSVQYSIQLDKKLGDQKKLADFGGFLAIGDFFGRQYYLSNCKS